MGQLTEFLLNSQNVHPAADRVGGRIDKYGMHMQNSSEDSQREVSENTSLLGSG